MYNQIVIFVTFHILQGKVGLSGNILKVWSKIFQVGLSCSKFNQLSNSEFFLKIFQQIDKFTVCNAISSFLGHAVY